MVTIGKLQELVVAARQTESAIKECVEKAQSQLEDLAAVLSEFMGVYGIAEMTIKAGSIHMVVSHDSYNMNMSPTPQEVQALMDAAQDVMTNTMAQRLETLNSLLGKC